MILKRIVKTLLLFIALGLFIIATLFAPIDRTPLEQQPFYNRMLAQLDTIPILTSKDANVMTGWQKVNITPPESMPMAGYIPRDHFDSVHDSLFARIITIQSEAALIALINIDLLLFPPALKESLTKKLAESKTNVFLYLSSTHTHNGIGGWDNSLMGNLALGTYNAKWVERTAQALFESIISQKQVASSIQYWESDASEFVQNRIAYEQGEKDGKLRGFNITRSDSTHACLFSYSAHATSISKKYYALSADYPGRVIQLLEREYDFGMYMGGMVGSHSFAPLDELQNFDLVDQEANRLLNKILIRKEFPKQDSLSVSMAHIPIEFGPSQLRISENWKVRNWVLSALFGNLQGELTYLRVGDIAMIGTPCDFSGEIYVRNGLDNFAAQRGKHLIVTSFNGNYTGYITYDAHYDVIKNAETRELNWVGPYYGAYFTTLIEKLLEKE